jgi:hypothetical protein
MRPLWRLKYSNPPPGHAPYKAFYDETEARIAHARCGGTLEYLEGEGMTPKWVRIEGGTDVESELPSDQHDEWLPNLYR